MDHLNRLLKRITMLGLRPKMFITLSRNRQKSLLRMLPKRNNGIIREYMGPKWKRQSDPSLSFKPLSQQAQSLKMYRAWQKRMVRSIRNSMLAHQPLTKEQNKFLKNQATRGNI